MNRKALCACALMLLWPLTAGSRDAVSARAPVWPDSFAARVVALALLQSLNADLLSHDSATLTLQHWCEVHRLASPPRIVAAVIREVDKPPTPDQRRELGVTPADPVRYRRVRLLCGTVVLSEADNWYVPGRLTPEMNELLETTDMPFGRVVQALHFQRHTLSSTLLWLPLPEGWEMAAASSSAPASSAAAASSSAAALSIPPQVLEHKAVLTLPDGTPFSEVVETYTENVLAFPMPGR
jgi:hypothetical protein